MFNTPQAVAHFEKWNLPVPQETLKHPPFALLTWEYGCWACDVVLPSWAGFQVRQGAYGAVSSMRVADGTAKLLISPLERSSRSNPMPEQVAAYQYLMQNDASVASSVVRAVIEYCPGHAYNEDNEELKVNDLADLRPLIGLSNVHLLHVADNGVACIGFEFGCVWDEEHGLGVMTHNGRVVATGAADHAFMEWIAEEGLGR